MKLMPKIVGGIVIASAVVAVGLTACGGEQPAKVSNEAKNDVVKSAPADTDDVVVEEEIVEEEVVVEEEEVDPDETAQLGDTVEIGDWSVKVTKVALNANAAIQKANMFNEKPRGQFVLVSYDATYNGSERTADAWMDLTWTLTGNDSKILDEAGTVTPADNKDVPTEARRGGTVSLQAVFDVRPKVLHGSILSVEGYDAGFDSIYADFVID